MVHAVEVSATSLYEAAVLALAQFRTGWLIQVLPGRATRLTVTIAAPATSHEVEVGKLEDWLARSGKSPSELVLKKRLLELLNKQRAPGS